jgi:hypothetical protein
MILSAMNIRSLTMGCRLDIEMLRDKNVELSSRVSELDARLFEALLQPHKKSVEDVLAGKARYSVRGRARAGRRKGEDELDSSDEELYLDVEEPGDSKIPLATGDIATGSDVSVTVDGKVAGDTKEPSSLSGQAKGEVRRITASDIRASKHRQSTNGASAGATAQEESVQEKEVAELRDVCGSLQHIVDSYEVQFQKMQVRLCSASVRTLPHGVPHVTLVDRMK